MKTYKGLITKLPNNGIAVVGTNPDGIPGAGAALWARKNAGLKVGHSIGPCGESYGIITKDLYSKIHPSIPMDHIRFQIYMLYRYAMNHQNSDFYIFYSGTTPNLNGYSNQEMADMFRMDIIPDNIIFEEDFSKLLKI